MLTAGNKVNAQNALNNREMPTVIYHNTYN